MSRLEQAVLVSREAQTSDTAVYRKDLPKSGAYSALDIGIRLTNGSTSAINLDLLDVIKRISLVFNGSDYKFHITAQEMYRYWWLKHGRPLPYMFTETGSEVQEVWFRLEFGRFLGDPQYGLNLEKWNNVQLQIDYDAVGQWGAAAATTFTTATFTVSVIAHQFPYNARPSFRGLLALREIWTQTSVASGDVVQDLPSQRPILGISIMAIEDNIAEATDVTDIVIGKDNFATTWLQGKWYNFQSLQNYDLDERMEVYQLYLSSSAVRDTHVANMRKAKCFSMAATAGAA